MTLPPRPWQVSGEFTRNTWRLALVLFAAAATGGPWLMWALRHDPAWIPDTDDRVVVLWVLTAAVMLACAVVILLGALRLRAWLDVRNAAVRCEQIEMQIDKVEQVVLRGAHGLGRIPTASYWYHCHVRLDDGYVATCSPKFDHDENQLPLFTDDSKLAVVAVVTPLAPRRPIVLRNDYYPFVIR